MAWNTGRMIRTMTPAQSQSGIGNVGAAMQSTGTPVYSSGYNFGSGITMPSAPQAHPSSQAIAGFANLPPQQPAASAYNPGTYAGGLQSSLTPYSSYSLAAPGSITGVPVTPGVPPSIEAGTFQTNAAPGGSIGGVTNPVLHRGHPGINQDLDPAARIARQQAKNEMLRAQAGGGIGGAGWGSALGDFLVQQRASGG